VSLECIIKYTGGVSKPEPPRLPDGKMTTDPDGGGDPSAKLGKRLHKGDDIIKIEREIVVVVS
jgi:hypothetical protein